MDLRDLVRHRAFLVRTRTKLKNKVHSILLMNGIRIDEKRYFSVGYVKKLKEIHNYRILQSNLPKKGKGKGDCCGCVKDALGDILDAQGKKRVSALQSRNYTG